jgi:hypothetical protein
VKIPEVGKRFGGCTTVSMPKRCRKKDGSKRSQLKKEDKLEILELRVEHKWSRARIAAKYNKSTRTIDRVLTRAAKDKTLGRKTKLHREEKNGIVAMIVANPAISCREIAQSPALSRIKVATVRKYLKKKGYLRNGTRKNPLWQKEEKK